MKILETLQCTSSNIVNIFTFLRQNESEKEQTELTQCIIVDNTCSWLKTNAVIVGNDLLTCKGDFEDTPE